MSEIFLLRKFSLVLTWFVLWSGIPSTPLSVPNFLISIALSARKKNFLGPHVVGQDLKSCVSVWLYNGPLDSVKMRTLRQGATWAHWPLQRPPHSGSCPAALWIAIIVWGLVWMEILFSGNICLIIHVPSPKFDVKKRICLLVSYLDL